MWVCLSVGISWPLSSMQFSSDFATGKSTLGISRRIGWRRKNRPTASQPPGPKRPSPAVQVSSPIHTGPLGIRVCAPGQLGLSFPGILSSFLYPPSSPPMATAPHFYHPFPALHLTVHSSFSDLACLTTQPGRNPLIVTGNDMLANVVPLPKYREEFFFFLILKIELLILYWSVAG